MFDASFFLAELFALEGDVAFGGFQFEAGNGGELMPVGVGVSDGKSGGQIERRDDQEACRFGLWDFLDVGKLEPVSRRDVFSAAFDVFDPGCEFAGDFGIG